MRLEQLEYVDAVAKYRSMNAAAQHLHVSQQNISKAIKKLEEELDVKIFNRTKMGTIPTVKGQLICEFASGQITEYHSMKQILYNMQKDKLEGQLSIFTMNSGSCMIIPEILSEFYKNCPHVDLKVRDTDTLSVLNQIMNDEADLGIVTYCIVKGKKYPDLPKEICLLPLLQGKWYYWVSIRSPFAKNGYITLKEANEASILCDKAMDEILLKELFRLYGLEVRIGQLASNLHLLEKLAFEQQGVIPDMKFSNGELMNGYVYGSQSGLVAVPVKEQAEYLGVGCIVKEKKQQSILLKFTLDFLREFSKRGEIE